MLSHAVPSALKRNIKTCASKYLCVQLELTQLPRILHLRDRLSGHAFDDFLLGGCQ